MATTEMAFRHDRGVNATGLDIPSRKIMKFPLL
jgi:hypothetical protein